MNKERTLLEMKQLNDKQRENQKLSAEELRRKQQLEYQKELVMQIVRRVLKAGTAERKEGTGQREGEDMG
jgi:hypothetical protein